MVKVYYGSNIDAVNWKIYVDNTQTGVTYFPSGTKPGQLVDNLCQYNLFDTKNEKKTCVVNIDEWKMTDKSTQTCIQQLHKIDDVVIFAIESSTCKNKIFASLKIETIKATAVTKKSKLSMIHKLLGENNIHLNFDLEQLMVELLPDNIFFIRNEIEKMKLLNQQTFSEDEIKQVIFDLGDATVFNIVDSWLNNNQEQTIERLNDLIAKNVNIQTFVPIFALKLTQIKFFLLAKLGRWSSDIIASKQGIPFWQQMIYSNLRPYDKKLEKINRMLEELYKFDINVKKQKNIPYTQLIKILFK